MVVRWSQRWDGEGDRQFGGGLWLAWPIVPSPQGQPGDMEKLDGMLHLQRYFIPMGFRSLFASGILLYRQAAGRASES